MDSDDIEKTYLYVNKRCGTISGVWPFADTRTKRIGRTTMMTLVVTGLITQVAKVLTNLSVDIVIEQCPFFMIGAGAIAKEMNYIIHAKQIIPLNIIIEKFQLKMLLECIFDDWLLNRPQNELDILDKYAKRGLFFNRLYVANGLFCYVIFSSVALTPRVLDLIAPKNESRGVGFIYPAYYGLDEEEHYYILMGHMLSVITVVFFVYISCDSIYMTVVQHACGLLSISGYRFKWAVEDDDMITVKKHPMLIQETYKKVRHSVQAHQHAIDICYPLIYFMQYMYVQNRYIAKIEKIHDTYLFILVGIVILSFTITLLRASMMEPCMEFYKYCGFLVVQLIHLLFLSIQGHFVIVAHDTTYDKMCDATWYNSTPRTQVLYALALRRNLTPPLLTAGGLISLNLETFSTILKSSVSWFTVIKSTVRTTDK